MGGRGERKKGKKENGPIEENLIVSTLHNWMDQVSIGKFPNHRKNNKARAIMSDKRKGSNLSLEKCQISG